jgi:hypothetical protein
MARRRCVEVLKAHGHIVEKSDFPQSPFPSLYRVDGRELTEMQTINFARQRHGATPDLS